MKIKRFRAVPWQRNIRKVPPEVTAKLAASPNSSFVVGVVKAIPREIVQTGVYDHLGLQAGGGIITDEGEIVPAEDMGKYSKRNAKGWLVIRKDKPKVVKTYSFDTPNFGDWSKGYHTVDIRREVYQWDFHEPPKFAIVITRLRDGANGEAIFSFAVKCTLDRSAPKFEETLLFALNLLQENIGSADVLRSDATVEELLSTLIVDWDIFPPGTVDEVVQRMLGKRGPGVTPDEEAILRERIGLFSKLKPKRYVQGRGTLGHYTGALFDDDLVVFENVRPGNALYVLYDNWEEISKRSRMSLLRERDVPFQRFVHTKGWATRFQAHIEAEKERRGLQ